jgi:formylglycine-generating enzyme required for sulfatase activity
MILVPAGWSWMGTDTHYVWEKPRHRVFLSDFWIAETTVTRGDYAKFLTATHHEIPRQWSDPLFGKANQPAVGVNWFDAVAYCKWYSDLSGDSFRLPTEAEWEKACRGKSDDLDYPWGNEPPESFEYFRGEWPGPRPVAQWRSNGYGAYNLGDNVHEWCSDWYAPDYYAKSPEENPQGPESGSRRVSRGGSWRHLVKASRAAHRSSLPPMFRYMDYGFRLARSG